MLYAPERRWIDRALCQDVSPALFFAENASQLGRTPFPHVQESWNKAKEICAQPCPGGMPTGHPR
ncbi:WhiB family transcriptional regulator [Streptomyces sp. NPDC019443]|uniref:WhiB family transcriptional regulator n=1 Tax=Streptomyces sp. NPDC019443 TaxID=3365061 RepID=UPI0037AAB423